MNSKRLLSLLLVLSVVLTGLLPSTAVYAAEVTNPGSDAKSTAILTTNGLIMEATVPYTVFIHVDEQGEVTTPDYLQITNHTAAPLKVESLTMTPKNGWTLDPVGTDYIGFKFNRKHFWMSFNGQDPSTGSIAFTTPINGYSSLDLDLSADVAPQLSTISALNICDIAIILDWDTDESTDDESTDEDNQGGNQDYGFEVGGATRVATRTFKFTLNASETGHYFVAATQANDTPPTDPFNYSVTEVIEVTEAGSKEYTVTFYNDDEWDEVDLYVWRIGDSGYEGPVKAEVRRTGGGGAESPSVGPHGEYIPAGYVMATDDDFVENSFPTHTFRYVGSAEYVVIPHYIKGKQVLSYYEMFKDTAVKGVSSDNPNITTAIGMFKGTTSDTLDLSHFDTSNIVNMSAMFSGSYVEVIDLSGFDTSSLTNTASMFASLRGVEQVIDLSSFDASRLTNIASMFSTTYADVTVYVRSEEDADIFRNAENTSSKVTFIVK